MKDWKQTNVFCINPLALYFTKWKVRIIRIISVQSVKQFTFVPTCDLCDRDSEGKTTLEMHMQCNHEHVSRDWFQVLKLFQCLISCTNRVSNHSQSRFSSLYIGYKACAAQAGWAQTTHGSHEYILLTYSLHSSLVYYMISSIMDSLSI